MILLDSTRSVASSVIFYQLLMSGDVEQNPGPGLDYDSVDSRQILDEEDHFDILGEISTLESRYYEIGMGLRLKTIELQSIENEIPSRRLSKVVEMWLQQRYNVQRHGPPTWQMLVIAVDSPAGGDDHTLARKIASKHPSAQARSLVPSIEKKKEQKGYEEKLTPTMMKQEACEEADADLLSNSNVKEIIDEMWDYRARWRLIGMELHIDTGTLDAIEMDHRTVADCLVKMITYWLRSDPRPTREVIRAAIQSKCISKDAAEESQSEVTNDRLEEYTSYLKSLYKAKTQASSTGDDHWPPPVTNKVFSLAMIKPEQVQRRNIDDHFVRETITGKIDDILQRKVRITLEDIFSEGEQQKTMLFEGAPGTPSEDKQKRMLIEGAPGCGKSTLSLHICHEWIAGRLLKEYSQVILVKLREKTVQDAKSIADLLPKRENSMGQNAEREIIIRDGEGVLFIFDGWDELPKKAPGHGVIQDILDCKKLHKSSIVITSRPISSVNLHKFVSTRIEIIGFTKDELKKYFTECLDNVDRKVRELQLRIKENPVIEGSCYLPLNASILVHLFKCDGVLPHTQFGIFSALIRNCIFRHLKKKNEKLDISGIKSLDKLPTAIQSQFERVCEIAYKGVIEDHVTFDLECSFDTLGLLQGVESFASGMPSYSYNFFHLSIQELLAAIHMATKLHPSDQVAQFQKLFGQARFSAVFQFYAAKTKLKTRGMDTIVLNIVQKCTKRKGVILFTHQSVAQRPEFSTLLVHKSQPLLLSLLHCLFEAQDDTLCQLVAKELKGELRGLQRISLNPADCLSVGYFLTYCRQFKVYLRDCFTDVDGCKALFKKDKEYDLQYLDLYSNSVGNEGAKALSGAMKMMANLKVLILRDNCIGDEGARVLADAMKKMANLMMLNLADNSIGDQGAKALSDAMKTMANLQQLALKWNIIGDIGRKALKEAAKKKGTSIAGLNHQIAVVKKINRK